MNPRFIAAVLLEFEYKYGCVMISAPPEVSDLLQDWGRLNIPDEKLYVSDEGGLGRERESHVTVKYGLMTDQVPESIYSLVHSTTPFPIVIGKVSIFRNPKYDVIKCDVESPQLRALNKAVSDAVPHHDTYPDYRPHLTIAYVISGSCDALEGMDIFADGQDREFIAYGMTWNGAGDSEDADRHEEVLLFSKIRQHSPVAEAVLEPSQKDLQAISNILDKAQNDAGGDPNRFVELVNPELARFGIRFGDHADFAVSPMSPALADADGVVIQPPKDLRYGRLSKKLMPIVHHELVHTRQMSRMDDPEEIAARATEYMAPEGRLDHDRYMQQKQEVMAFAASMVQAWRAKGLTRDQMKVRLRTGEDFGVACRYWFNRRSMPDTFRRFIRYADQYIDSELDESAKESSPFDDMPFPSTADQVRKFKARRRAKRRAVL